MIGNRHSLVGALGLTSERRPELKFQIKPLLPFQIDEVRDQSYHFHLILTPFNALDSHLRGSLNKALVDKYQKTSAKASNQSCFIPF